MDNKLKIIALLLFGLVTLGVRVDAQPSTYVYMFSTWNSSGEFVLHQINPFDETLEIIPTQSLVELPTEHRLVHLDISPDGTWIIAFIDGLTLTNNAFVRFINTVTNEAFNVLEPTYWSLRSEWSPSNAMLATMVDGYLYTYDLIARTAHLVASPQNGQIDILKWSPNGEELIFMQNPICNSQPCDSNLYTYNIMMETITHSLVFRTFRSGMCETEISPDSNHMTFVFACSDPLVYFLRDLYIWELNSSTPLRLTDFGQTVVNNAAEIDRSISNTTEIYPVWYSNDELITGFYSVVERSDGAHADTLEVGTVVYDTSGNILRTLSSSYLHNWSISPDGIWITYTETIPQVTSSGGKSELKVEDIATHVSQWDSTSLISVHNLPPGCDYDWSPDSRFLVQTDCEFETGSFTILDMEDGRTFTVDVSPMQYVRSIGWIPDAISN